MTIDELATTVRERVGQMLARGPDGGHDREDLEASLRLLGAAVVLYSTLSEHHADVGDLGALDVSTTDAATAAAALLLSQNLSVFEFNMWFARAAQMRDSTSPGEGRD